MGHLLFVLLYAGLICFLLALLYPSEMSTDFDARAHLDANRSWFFISLLLLGAVELADTFYKEGTGLLEPGPGLFGPTRWYPVFMLVWIAGSAVAAGVRSRRFNWCFAVVFFLCVVSNLTSHGTLESALQGTGGP